MWYKKFGVGRRRKRKVDVIVTGLIGLLLVIFFSNPLYSCLGCQKREIEICFTPGGDCVQLVERVIGQAAHQILVQAYFFTSPRIAQALIAAHNRGVVVKMLVDRSQLDKKQVQLKKLVSSGIIVLVDKVPGIAHNKVMIIDDWYVLTGSYNWTRGAEYKNAENLLLITDKNTNQVYRRNWEQRAQQARPISMVDIGKGAR